MMKQLTIAPTDSPNVSDAKQGALDILQKTLKSQSEDNNKESEDAKGQENQVAEHMEE